MRQRLLAGARQLGLSLSEIQAAALERYVEEMLAWNARINLTAITQPASVISHHILDSLAVAPHLAEGSVLDVGSGAGLPSLPLALLRPDLRFTSIDSRHKKIAFQRHAARLMALQNFEAVCARVEDWQPDAPYAQIISRAFASLADFAALAGQHLAADGRLLAMKGREPQEELAEMSGTWRLVRMQRLFVPGLSAERHLVILARAPA